ncbi:GNAT family N-acetyltransferase [Halocatena marina]|uniref:GNAT family N-acetyltransferase n=1 Tax=Halocatena marina TaxID=2934937 RepID=A0ABD5YW41_9EURY|nr:GNAT family N-acetyltransferase [Halocatena marina]
MPTGEIREAVTADASDLATVYQSAYRENRERGFPAKAESVNERAVAEWIDEYRVYVAVDSDVIGGVRLEETAAERVKLSRLGVHDQWKGNGVGSRLIEHAENAMRGSGYATIWLTTPQDHPYLPEMYRRRGYEKTELYPLEYRRYDEIVMEKQL